MPSRSYTDDELARAVAESHSWRGVLRQLGLAATSSSAIRSVRLRAATLGLDCGHFTGQRRWGDDDLAAAIAGATSWTEVSERLGLAGGSGTSGLKGHAARLRLDVGHLSWPRRHVSDGSDTSTPDLAHLPQAGSMLAAAWFTLCGDEVSWPLEPCAYDLMVGRGGRFLRIQVKTTRLRAGNTWAVTLLTGGRNRSSYDPDTIDHFFVIDGDLRQYLIPVAAVGGRQTVHVAAYAAYELATLEVTGASSR